MIEAFLYGFAGIFGAAVASLIIAIIYFRLIEMGRDEE